MVCTESRHRRRGVDDRDSRRRPSDIEDRSLLPALPSPTARRFVILCSDSTETGFIGIGTLDVPGVEPIPDYVPWSQVEYAPPGYLFRSAGRRYAPTDSTPPRGRFVGN
jgi:hypothetical protein